VGASPTRQTLQPSGSTRPGDTLDRQHAAASTKPAIGQHLVLVVAAAVDAGDAHPQFATGFGAVGFRQHAVQQVPDLALRWISRQNFVARRPGFLEGAEAEYLHFDAIALHVDSRGEQLHRVRDTLRAVILATTQQRPCCQFEIFALMSNSTFIAQMHGSG
jgi:hypothetical protein